MTTLDLPRESFNLPHDFQSDKLVTPEQTAELLSISLATLRRMWRNGEGPRVVRVSPRRQGVRLRDIASYLQSR